MKHLLLFFILLFTPAPVFAGTDLVVTCNQDDQCLLNSQSPLFAESNLYPGAIRSQNLTIINDRSDTCFPTFNLDNQSLPVTVDLLDKLNLSITSGSMVWYSGYLSNLLDHNYRTLGTLDKNSSRPYFWSISLDQSTGNDYQNKSTKFDLNFNFSCYQDDELPTPTSIPTPSPTSTPTPVVNPSIGISLNEIMPAPSSGQEWVEIYNGNDYSVILRNWQFDDIESSGNLPKNLEEIFMANHSFYTFDLNDYLNNTDDSARLINQVPAEVDKYSYSTTDYRYSYSRQPDGNWCLTLPSKNSINNPCLNITPTNTPAPSNSSPAVLGTSIDNSCHDSTPGTPSNLVATVSGPDQATLTWISAPPPFTSYLIAYGTSPGVYQFGNPNVGTDNHYVVSKLVPGAQYCFYVRAQNGCMPGVASNESCINLGSQIIVAPTPLPGFQPNILGANSNLPSTGDIAGSTSSNCHGLLLLIILIICFLINIISFVITPKIILPLFVFLINYLIQIKFNSPDCCLLPPNICPFYWLTYYLVFLLPFVARLLFTKFAKKP